MGRYKKIYLKAELYGVLKDSGIHELICVEEIEPSKLMELMQKEESASDDQRIDEVFGDEEELQSKELIKRIREEFQCGQKAAYMKLKKYKNGGKRKVGRTVWYKKADFVDSVPNKVEVGTEDYQNDLDKFLEENGFEEKDFESDGITDEMREAMDGLCGDPEEMREEWGV